MSAYRWEVAIYTHDKEVYHNYTNRETAEKSYYNKIQYYGKVYPQPAEIQLNDLENGITLKDTHV